jgi:hypothetical protein
MPRHKFQKGNKFASKEHKELVAQIKSPEERLASKALLKNRVKSLTVAEVLEENANAIVDKCIEMALGGDSTCMKLCMERLLPPRKFIQMESRITAMGILGLLTSEQEQEIIEYEEIKDE